jgi:hypothetical protein
MLFSESDFRENIQRFAKHFKIFSQIQEKIRFHQREKFRDKKMSVTSSFEPILIILTIFYIIFSIV